MLQKTNSLTHSLTSEFEKENKTAIQDAYDQWETEQKNADKSFLRYLKSIPNMADIEDTIAKRVKLFAGGDKPSRTIRNRRKAEDFVEVQDFIQQINYSKSRTKYWFVTINPKPTVKIADLHNAIVKMLDREEIIDCLWTYEIRQEPDKGLHAHVCFQTDRIMDSNFVQRKIKNLFVPKLCGNTKHVDVRWPDSEEEYIEAKAYALKTKVSKSKKKGNDATKTWRTLNGIHDGYTEDHLLVWSSLPKPIILLN